jgi:DinB superfamily
MQALSPAPLQAPISLMEKTPGILELLLHDASPDFLPWKPASECWSILEVLAHLAAIEQIYVTRVLQQKSAREHFEHFASLRRAQAVFLHTVPAAAALRTAGHPEMGTVGVSHLLHELANHDLGHLRHIAELYRAHAFYPHAGPLQRYSQPKP